MLKYVNEQNLLTHGLISNRSLNQNKRFVQHKAATSQINIKLLIRKPSSAQHLSLCSPDGLLSNNRRLIRNKYSDCSAAADGKDARENPNCDVSSDGIRKMTRHHLLVYL